MAKMIKCPECADNPRYTEALDVPLTGGVNRHPRRRLCPLCMGAKKVWDFQAKDFQAEKDKETPVMLY